MTTDRLPGRLDGETQVEMDLALPATDDRRVPVPPKVYTGAQLFRRDPARYRRIVGLLAQGLGLWRVAKLVECSVNTVRAVRDREHVAVDTLKQVLAAALWDASSIGAERLVGQMETEKIAPRDMAVIVGILVDKAQLLSGGPTARLDVGASAPEHEEWNQVLAGLRDGPAGRTGAAPGTKGGPALEGTAEWAGTGGESPGGRSLGPGRTQEAPGEGRPADGAGGEGEPSSGASGGRE